MEKMFSLKMIRCTQCNGVKKVLISIDGSDRITTSFHCDQEYKKIKFNKKFVLTEIVDEIWREKGEKLEIRLFVHFRDLLLGRKL